jgi:hypothetical protein
MQILTTNRFPICAAPATVLAKYPERTSAEQQHFAAFKMLRCTRGHFFTAGDQRRGSRSEVNRK